MWTSDIISALEIFERQFNDGFTECIENIHTDKFGHIIVQYGGMKYTFNKVYKEWVKITEVM